MSWYFLTAGFILIGVSLYEKIKLYKNHSSSGSKKTKEIKSAASEKINFTSEKSRRNPNLEKKLDQVLNMLKTSNQEILEEIEQKSFEESDSDTRDLGGNFKKILQKKYEKDTNSNKNLPKKYKKVFSMRSRGKKASDIARELDIGIRETRLILKLYQKYENDEGQIHNVH